MLSFCISQQLCSILEQAIDLQLRNVGLFQTLPLVNYMALGKLSHFSKWRFSIYKMLNVSYMVFKESKNCKWKFLVLLL